MNQKSTNQYREISILLMLLFFIFVSNSNLFPQNIKIKSDEYSFATPYEAITHHIKYLSNNNYHPEIAVFSLDVDNFSSEEAKELGIWLKKIFDGKGLTINPEQLPKDTNYTDSTTKLNKYILFAKYPQIYVEKVTNKWLYSKETIKALPLIYESIYPFEADDYIKKFPPFVKNKFLGIFVWQYIGTVIYILTSLILYKLLGWIFGFLIIRSIAKFKYKNIASRYIKRIARPTSALITILILTVFLPILELPIKPVKIIYFILNLFTPIIFTIIAYRLTDLLSDIFAFLASKTKSTVDDNLVPFARRVIKFGVIITGSIFIFEGLHINILPILAGASIGGLAFALAAQETIKDLFGSITIFTDQPFEVGDWIIFSGGEGVVEEIRMRSTRIRTFYDSVISVPNGKLADMTIDNMGKRIYRRYVTKLAITYGTPPDLIDAFIEGIKTIIGEHPDTRKDLYQVKLDDFTGSSLSITLYLFFQVPDWSEELAARQKLIIEVIRLAEELEIRFAFHSHTVQIQDFKNKDSLNDNNNETRTDFFSKLKRFFEKKDKIAYNNQINQTH